MNNSVQVEYRVAVSIDPEVWQANYGLPDESEIPGDIATYLQEAIETSVRHIIDSTGNEGTVSVRRGE